MRDGGVGMNVIADLTNQMGGRVSGGDQRREIHAAHD